MTTAVVTRNTKGLVDALFDSMDKLNTKQIDPEHARALSHTARTIVGIASLELEVRKFNKEKGSEPEELKSLIIEGQATQKDS